MANNSVEPFHIGILLWLAGLDVLQLDTLLSGPGH